MEPLPRFSAPPPAAPAVTGHRPLHLLDATMFWHPQTGGVRRYLLTKRGWLARQAQWRHTLLAPGAEGAGMIDCGGLSIPLSGGYRLPWRRQHAAELIRREAPDLIESGDPYRLAWAVLDAAHSLGVPTIAFCHSNLPAMAAKLGGAPVGPPSLVQRSTENYLRRLYGAFDLVLAPSRFMTGVLRDLGVPHAEHQPLGVDCQVFHPCRRDPMLRAALGLPGDARLLLYTGRFAPEKNLGVLVRAVARLGPPYYLLAVGAGPMPPQGERVIVLPHESREAMLARLYASAHAFVHAGDQETFGLSALEAMACGTPIVVRARAGLGELCVDQAGIAVEGTDAETWAEAVASVQDPDTQLRVRLARARAQEMDWREVLPGLVERYGRLLGQGRRQPLAVQEPRAGVARVG
ncbi:MAG: glycosyltransferase [Candidatus Dactylopiibacterium sp.]|nr:glycosyltransferase [Candidatus Dactylopiibacterium sp.]